MKYIAGKHNLVPNTEKERLRVNLLEGEAEDFRHMWAMLCYSPITVSNPKQRLFLLQYFMTIAL